MAHANDIPDTSDGIPSDYGGSEDSKSPSLEEMKANVDLMSRLMAESMKDLEKGVKRRNKAKNPPTQSIIDGTFLSIVFALVLMLIISVSVYAFYNLFLAIMKKFPSRHTEL